VDINFVKPKIPSVSVNMKTSLKKTSQQVQEPTEAEKSAFIETIKSICLRSAILNVTSLKIGPKVNTGRANRLPPLTSHLKDLSQFRNKSRIDLENESNELLEYLKFTSEQAQYLIESTVLQSKSVL
jgi:hypothetical protein